MCAFAAGSPDRATTAGADPRAEIVVPVDVVRANALAGRSMESCVPVALTADGVTAPPGAEIETSVGETPLRSSLDVATIRVRPSKCAPESTGAACAAAGVISSAASATRNPLMPASCARWAGAASGNCRENGLADHAGGHGVVGRLVDQDERAGGVALRVRVGRDVAAE